MIDNTFHGQVLRRLIESGQRRELAVVIAAQQRTVLDSRLTAEGPVADVVGLAQPGRGGAARERAALVARCEHQPLGFAEQSLAQRV
jgi:hypothetical protein